MHGKSMGDYKNITKKIKHVPLRDDPIILIFSFLPESPSPFATI